MKIDCVYYRDGVCFNETFVSSFVPGRKTMTVAPGACAICGVRVPITVGGLPIQKIPDDYDPEMERRRLRQGGCCGKPSRSTE